MVKKRKKARPIGTARRTLPPGVKLVHTLRGHMASIGSIAWSPDGQLLASPSNDQTIRLWDAKTGECLRRLDGQMNIHSVAFDPAGQILAGSSLETIKLWEASSGRLLSSLAGPTGIHSIAFNPAGHTLASGSEYTVNLWEGSSGRLLRTLKGDQGTGYGICYHPEGRLLASGSKGGAVYLWDVDSGELLHALKSHNSYVFAVQFTRDGRILASASTDGTVKMWDVDSGHLLRTLEGHTGALRGVAFSSDGSFLASQGFAGRVSICLWRVDTGSRIVIGDEGSSNYVISGLAFNPRLPLLASVGADTDTPSREGDRVIHIWELNPAVLLAQHHSSLVTYTSAKVVLVGESGVGKTGLGWRLAHGEFKEHASTHGQQFWLLRQLCQKRRDGAQCEAVLWDLAGQPDYRLIHALFLDDADLALVLFDPTRNDDPLKGVEFWLKQLRVGTSASHELPLPKGGTPTILVAARSDRGSPRLTEDELEAFCQRRGLAGYLSTSAKDGDGVDKLVQRMEALILWDDKPATVTTQTFKRIKDYVLGLKENGRRRKVIFAPEELRKRLKNSHRKWKFTDVEMLTSVGHLANHGYVTRLKTSSGEQRLLLRPELLNNLAASFVLEARRNQRGLGSLEEQRLLSGKYTFPELEKLGNSEQAILLDSAAVLFLEHNICFRETDPLNNLAYLVFPELINLKRPLEGDDKPVEDGVAYTVSGAVENVYASLVVLLGYTHTFTRTNQWQNHARYEVGDGVVCGFRLEAERDGGLDFVLYFGTNADSPVRTLFQSLFESFLARHNLTVRRFEPVGCSKGHLLNRAVVREQMSGGVALAFCSKCGEKIALPKADKPIQLTKQQATDVEVQRRAADERSRFEQVLFRLKTYVTERKITSPECFISYAWGNAEQEHWVEHSLATDLLKAGIRVVLDRWENARIGASVPRFVERAGKSDRVIVVGTPLYRTKYENSKPMRGFVVAAEGDLIGKRMIGAEAKKESVLPVLLEGTEESAFPHLLHGRVYADFRKTEAYFATTFDLILSLYEIKPRESIVTELRESLVGLKIS